MKYELQKILDIMDCQKDKHMGVSSDQTGTLIQKQKMSKLRPHHEKTKFARKGNNVGKI